MRRPAWYRALIGLWGLWLTAALAEAPGLHACAVLGDHSARPGQSPAAAHAGHHMAGAYSPEGAGQDDSSGQAPANCTCLGTCCCAAPSAASSRPIDLPEAALVATTAIAFSIASSAVVQRDHSQPFANAPPAA